MLDHNKEIETIQRTYKDHLYNLKNKNIPIIKKNPSTNLYLSKNNLINNEDKLIPLQRKFRNINKNKDNLNNIQVIKKPYEIINSNEYISKERKTNDNEKIKPIQRTFKKIKYQKEIKQEVKTDIIKPINKLQFNNLDSYITKEVKDSTLDKDKIINLQRKILENHKNKKRRLN